MMNVERWQGVSAATHCDRIRLCVGVDNAVGTPAQRFA